MFSYCLDENWNIWTDLSKVVVVSTHKIIGMDILFEWGNIPLLCKAESMHLFFVTCYLDMLRRNLYKFSSSNRFSFSFNFYWNTAIYNVVLVSGLYHSDSVIRIHAVMSLISNICLQAYDISCPALLLHFLSVRSNSCSLPGPGRLCYI